jgi:uncharacterized protein YbjT (DUF2867 family)
MLLVIGASGHIGRELVSILSSNRIPTTAVTRDTAHAKAMPGIRWVKADLSEPATLPGVFGGARRVFLLTANSPDLAALQINAIRAAREAGVDHVVKLSALGASDHSTSPIATAHYRAELELLASGMAWTILRPHVFMQNLLDQAPTIAAEGKIYAASGSGKIPFIDTRDIAAVAAVALTESGHEGKKYVLTGPEALSYYDVAGILAEVLGHRVEYAAESLEEARDRMRKAGAPSWAIDSLVALATYQRAGGPTSIVQDTVERITGRPPHSFREFAKDHASIFLGAPRATR